MVDDNRSDRPENRGADGAGKPNGAGSLETRRRHLEAELAAHRKKVAPEGGGRRETGGFALAVKLSSEFVAGVLVGAALGWALDYYVGTSPWGLIFFLLLGFCAGVLNVLRSTGAVSTPQPGQRRGGGNGQGTEE